MSARGLCLDCGKRRACEAADQLAGGFGPYYEQWRAGMLDFVGELDRADAGQ